MSSSSNPEYFQSQAEQYMREGEWEKAALAFSRAQTPFEEVALRLLSHRFKVRDLLQKEPVSAEIPPAQALSALRTYLSEVLLNLPVGAKSQRTMLCTWLCEIFLHQIASARLLTLVEAEKSLTQECMAFLRANRLSFDVSTILQLLVSRNARALLLFFVKIMGDYYRVTSVLLSEKRYQEALSVLFDAPVEKVSNFLYKITPLLVTIEPEKTFHLLASKTTGSVTPCLPTLLHYTRSVAAHKPPLPSSGQSVAEEDIPFFHAIHFLEEMLSRSGVFLSHHTTLDDEHVPGCVDQEALDANGLDAVVCHTYASLLAQSAQYGLEYKIVNLLKVLDLLQSNGLAPAALDPHFLLRQCRLFRCKTASVYALLLAGDRVQAVKEAMLLDVLLAKQIASRADSVEERRELWLEIAQYVVAHEDDMKKAVTLIRDSKNALTIEDLLPLLPDFTEIDFFKDEICKSLEDCSSSINGIKLEMQQLADDVDHTVNELENMKNRAYSVAYGNQKCDLCSGDLHNNQFYLFPCGHGFHAQCLVDSAMHSLDPAQVAELQRIQSAMNVIPRVTNQQEARLRASQQEQLQQQLEGLIASDCPLCGFAIIKKINQSLLEESSEEEKASWQL